MSTVLASRLSAGLALCCLGFALAIPSTLPAQEPAAPGVKYTVQGQADRLSMTVNTSRILEFPFDVPKVMVNNKDLVTLIPLTARSIQVSAVKQGTTQLNVWSSDDKITSIDVIINGDVQELEGILRTEFPEASLRLRTLNSSLHISGFVPKAESVSQILAIARDYFPNIIDGMTVGGVQKVILHVKVLEVSRTKLRNFGFDWANLSSGGFVVQGASSLVPASPAQLIAPVPLNASTLRFAINSGSESFQGFLEALERNNLAKLLSEPTLTTISGRPADFSVGGKIPIPVPQSLGVTTIEYRDFGTRVDFVPIVLGNGNVRLEVRAEVTEIDPSISAAIGTGTVPGFRTREANTAAEMKTGQTLAIAGLVFNKQDASVRGFPWLMDMPWAGAAFRRVSYQENELELVILVTPEFCEAMDATEVPPCGPGQLSAPPTDVELYWRSYLEVPKACGNGDCPPGFRGPGPMGGSGVEELPAPGKGGQSARRPLPPTPNSYPSLRTAQGPKTTAVGTGASTGRTAATSSGRTSPTSGSKPTPAAAKPVAGAKPALIGPLGYDDLK